MWLVLLAAIGADPNVAPNQAELLKTFREEFVQITPGEGKFPAEFKQGDKTIPISQPVHPVRMTKTFSIAKYEVPQNLWQTVTGRNRSEWKGPRNSAENINYLEAVEFCRAATKLMREKNLIKPTEEIRLPSESEWEYCCRAGTPTKYSFGDLETELNDYCWHTGNAATNDPPVGAKKPNAWGLYDMHGYLREWCADVAEESYANAPADGEARFVGFAGHRVIRGGSWTDIAEDCTSASRKIVSHRLRDAATGVRCVLADAPTEPTPFKPAAQEKFFPADAKLELLWGEGEFTEGPALAPDGSIFFSDIGNAIWRFDPGTKETKKFRDPSGRANGLMFNSKGEIIACEGANSGGGRRLSITSGIVGAKDGEVKTLSPGLNGKKFNSPNDLSIDPDGTVYMSDPRYVGDEPRELDFEAVFAIQPTGETKVVTTEVEKPNGILAPAARRSEAGGNRLIVADNNPNGARQLLLFVRNALPGKTEEVWTKTILWDFRAGRGIDGMTIDTDGNIYATAGTGDHAGIYVFDPDGKPQAFIATPGDPTNCVFGGGKDGSTLYITAAVDRAGSKYGLFRVKTLKKGYHVVKLQPGVAE